MLLRYKEWVKRHPSVVQNLDWLLLLTVWNPSRTSGGSEFTYEAYHAAVGLLSLWHQSIVEKEQLPTERPAPYLWLDAIEYLETLIELRGMHLERQGKMNRYSPLIVVETVKAFLKMAAWSRYTNHMFLRRPCPDDLHQYESELGLQDVLASLERLHRKYTTAPEPSASVAGGAPACACARVARSQAGGAGTWPTDGRGSGSARGAASGTSLRRCAAELSGCYSKPASCCPNADGGGGAGAVGGESFGLREYVGQHLGQWTRALRVPFGSWRRSASGGAGCTTGSDCGGCQAATRGDEAARSCCRAPSGEGCGPRSAADGAAALAAAATARSGHGGNSGACVASGGSPARQYGSYSGGRNGTGAEAGDGTQCWRQRQGQGRQQAVLWSLQLEATEVPEAEAKEQEDSDERMGRNLLWLAELLHIWRPVVYVTMLKRYGRRSWRPWATSLAVDLLSGHFHRRGHQHLAAAAARVAAAATAAAAGNESGAGNGDTKDFASTVPPPPPPPRGRVGMPHGTGTSLLSLALARSLTAPGITAGEDRELYDRRRKMALYAFRSPFLEGTTLSLLAALRDATRHLPLLGFGADYLYGLVETFTAYYSYTSGSN